MNNERNIKSPDIYIFSDSNLSTSSLTIPTFTNTDQNIRLQNELIKTESNLSVSTPTLPPFSEQNKRLSNIHTTLDSNLSTSLLTIPSFIKLNTPPTKLNKLSATPKILPAFHDPLFLNYIFYIPKTISHILKHKMPFTYLLIPENRIEVYKDKELLTYFDIMFYGTEVTSVSNIVFVINRKKYIRTNKLNQNKLYKQCIEDSTKYICDSEIKKYESNLKVKQIEENVNFFYVETDEDLVQNLKAIVKNYDIKKNYYKKMKSFKEPNKYLEYVIGSVTGIGSNVGKSIAEKFEGVCDFYEYMVAEGAEIGKLEEFEVYNEDRTCVRKLGNKQANILRIIFTSKNGTDEF